MVRCRIQRPASPWVHHMTDKNKSTDKYFQKLENTMPETIFHLPGLRTQDDADAVMFELQDLPCVDMAEASLVSQTVWVSHTALMTPLDIVAVLEQAGYEASLL